MMTAIDLRAARPDAACCRQLSTRRSVTPRSCREAHLTAHPRDRPQDILGAVKRSYCGKLPPPSERG